MSALLVLLVGAVIVTAGIVTVTRRNPIHAALSMLIALGGLAGLFLSLHAPFLAAMQLLLYGGAIMVLFVFIIMLLTLRDDELGPEPPQKTRLLAMMGSFLLLFVLCFALASRNKTELQTPYPETAEAKANANAGGEQVGFGSTEHFARFLYTDYAVAFELITVLIMAAVAGVIVLARKPDSATLERTRLTGGAS